MFADAFVDAFYDNFRPNKSEILLLEVTDGEGIEFLGFGRECLFLFD